MSYKKDLLLLVIDKLLIGGIILYVVFWINKNFERFKNEQIKLRELENQKKELEIKLKLEKRGKNLEYLEKQIKEFYWPIYLRLEKDNAMWEKVPKLSKSGNSLPNEASDLFENDFIIPNHEEIVKIIEEKTFLIENDNELINVLIAYIRHVAVYKTIRKTDILKHLNPIDVNEPYPHELFALIKAKLWSLQNDYSIILNSSKIN